MSVESLRNRKRTSPSAAVFLGVALILSGCKSSAPAPGVRNSDGSITNADGSITYPPGTAPAPAASAPTSPAPVATRNPDGSTTNPDGSVTYPAGSKRAEREKEPSVNQSAGQQPNGGQYPGAPSVQPAPRPEPVARVVPSGTSVPVTLTETLSASRNNAGDSFSGVLQRSITSSSGAVVFERGARVTGTVVAAKGKGRFKGSGDLAIELTSIGGARVSTTEYEAVNKGRGKRTAGIIGGGTGLGAIIGGLAGGGKGALIGGLAGAGAGTAGAAYTGNRDVVIPSESSIVFQLTAPVTVR